MKIIRLDPKMNELQVDRYCANHNLRPIRFLPGRPGSPKCSERTHMLLATEIRT